MKRMASCDLQGSSPIFSAVIPASAVRMMYSFAFVDTVQRIVHSGSHRPPRLPAQATARFIWKSPARHQGQFVATAISRRHVVHLGAVIVYLVIGSHSTYS